MAQSGDSNSHTAQFFATDGAVNNLVIAAAIDTVSSFVVLDLLFTGSMTQSGNGNRLTAQFFTAQGAINNLVIAARIDTVSGNFVLDLLDLLTVLLGHIQSSQDFLSNVCIAIIGGNQSVGAAQQNQQVQQIIVQSNVNSQVAVAQLHIGSVDINDIFIQEAFSQSLHVDNIHQRLDEVAGIDLMRATNKADGIQLIVGADDHDLGIGVDSLNLIDQLDVADLLQSEGVSISFSSSQNGFGGVGIETILDQTLLQLSQSLGNQLVDSIVGDLGPIGLIVIGINQVLDHVLQSRQVAEADGDQVSVCNRIHCLTLISQHFQCIIHSHLIRNQIGILADILYAQQLSQDLGIADLIIFSNSKDIADGNIGAVAEQIQVSMGSVEVTLFQIQVIHIDIDQMLSLITVLGVQLTGNIHDLGLVVLQEVDTVTQVAQNPSAQGIGQVNATGGNLHSKHNQVEMVVQQIQSVGAKLGQHLQAVHTKLLNQSANLIGVVAQPVVSLDVHITAQVFLQEIIGDAQSLLGNIQSLGNHSLGQTHVGTQGSVQGNGLSNALVHGLVQLGQHFGLLRHLHAFEVEIVLRQINSLQLGLTHAIGFFNTVTIGIGLDLKRTNIEANDGITMNVDLTDFELSQFVVGSNQRIDILVQIHQSIPSGIVVSLQGVDGVTDVRYRGLGVSDSNAQISIGLLHVINQSTSLLDGLTGDLNGSLCVSDQSLSVHDDQLSVVDNALIVLNSIVDLSDISLYLHHGIFSQGDLLFHLSQLLIELFFKLGFEFDLSISLGIVDSLLDLFSFLGYSIGSLFVESGPSLFALGIISSPSFSLSLSSLLLSLSLGIGILLTSISNLFVELGLDLLSFSIELILSLCSLGIELSVSSVDSSLICASQSQLLVQFSLCIGQFLIQLSLLSSDLIVQLSLLVSNLVFHLQLLVSQSLVQLSLFIGDHLLQIFFCILQSVLQLGALRLILLTDSIFKLLPGIFLGISDHLAKLLESLIISSLSQFGQLLAFQHILGISQLLLCFSQLLVSGGHIAIFKSAIVNISSQLCKFCFSIQQLLLCVCQSGDGIRKGDKFQLINHIFQLINHGVQLINLAVDLGIDLIQGAIDRIANCKRDGISAHTQQQAEHQRQGENGTDCFIKHPFLPPLF